MKVQRRRVCILVPLAMAAAVLATASTAWACTTFGGQTRINGAVAGATASKGGSVLNITGDDVPSTSGWPADTSVSNIKWYVSANQDGSGCCYGGSVLVAGVPLTRSNTAADLGPKNGTAPTWNGGGSRLYQVCYIPESGSLTATSVAYLTVG